MENCSVPGIIVTTLQVFLPPCTCYVFCLSAHRVDAAESIPFSVGSTQRIRLCVRRPFVHTTDTMEASVKACIISRVRGETLYRMDRSGISFERTVGGYTPTIVVHSPDTSLQQLEQQLHSTSGSGSAQSAQKLEIIQ